LPIVSIGGGVFRGIVKEGMKEVVISEKIRVCRSGCIPIETLRRANGNLEYLVGSFWCLEKSKC
jgi:hypothetical protein